MITPDAGDKTGSPICLDKYNFSPAEVLSAITLPEYILYTLYCLEYKTLIVEQLSERKEQEILSQLVAKYSEDPGM